MLRPRHLETAAHFSHSSCEAPRCAVCTVPTRRLDWVFVQIGRARWHRADPARGAFLGCFAISHTAAAGTAEPLFLLAGHVSRSRGLWKGGSGDTFPLRIRRVGATKLLPIGN